MKTVIEMAREAGWKDLRDYDSQMRHDFFMGNTDSLERFASLVRADERARMAEQPAQQEPVECANGCRGFVKYSPQPPAQRKPLTDAQINAFFEGMEPNNGFWLSFARAIEAAHGIGVDK